MKTITRESEKTAQPAEPTQGPVCDYWGPDGTGCRQRAAWRFRVRSECACEFQRVVHACAEHVHLIHRARRIGLLTGHDATCFWCGCYQLIGEGERL